MLKSLRWLLTGFAVLSLVALASAAVVYWAWDVFSGIPHYRRAEFPPDVPLGKKICSDGSTGLIEGSSIAVFQLDPEFADHLAREGPTALDPNTPPPGADDWRWSPWMVVGTGSDLLAPGHARADESAGSRARMFVKGANERTRDRCGTVTRHFGWEGAVVRFKYPRKWSVERCEDSCLAQVLLPVPRLAISATFD